MMSPSSQILCSLDNDSELALIPGPLDDFATFAYPQLACMMTTGSAILSSFDSAPILGLLDDGNVRAPSLTRLMMSPHSPFLSSLGK
ncbi:hypothetical protein P4H46_19755 [Paenibacillus glucanolyticus]|uniref:hypothetical protein n=1 Tax=Paenibacillus glucanolyticus TaxID=59843 RepID=UPI0030C8F555